MACRGVFFAVTEHEVAQLLALVNNPDELSDQANLLYSDAREEAGFQASVDKAWDAMHRCLSDGLLNDIGEGVTPLAHMVLGGANLYDGTSYIICLATVDQVRETATAVAGITKKWMHDRYFKLDPRQYDGPWNEQDWEYTWSYFEEAREVYQNAAKAGRAVIFLTDQ